MSAPQPGCLSLFFVSWVSTGDAGATEYAPPMYNLFMSKSSRFLIVFLILVFPSSLFAVPMTTDPGGFLEFPWKISLDGRKDLSPDEDKGRMKTYVLTRNPLKIGEVPVSSIKLITLDGKFARAIVRYEGMETHAALLAALQRWFGPLDFTPGQLGAGAQAQETFNWRGEETDINLAYDRRTDKGVMYVESISLGLNFAE